MIVKKVAVYRSCAICHRTLLMGEEALRYSPIPGEWVDVCALCTGEANEHGWVKEGTPTTPMVGSARRRRLRRLRGLGFLDLRRAEPEAQLSEPVLRRLSLPEQAIVDAAELFNESAFRRTVAGVAKSLGEPQVSLLALSGVNPEVVITVAWEISWYQYRVVIGSGQPVRLAERGYELEELDERFTHWNGRLDAEGNVLPDIPRI